MPGIFVTSIPPRTPKAIPGNPCRWKEHELERNTYSQLISRKHGRERRCPQKRDRYLPGQQLNVLMSEVPNTIEFGHVNIQGIDPETLVPAHNHHDKTLQKQHRVFSLLLCRVQET